MLQTFTNYPWAICRSKIAKLKEEIATLQAELAAIAKAQKEADAMRAEEGAAWKEAKADYESGVEGVGMALQVLRDYYAEKEEAFVQTTHDKATGAASGIIGMLEVVESRGFFSRVCRLGTHGEALFCKPFLAICSEALRMRSSQYHFAIAGT